MRMTSWSLACGCGWKGKILCWDYELPYSCPDCSKPTDFESARVGKAPGVIGDELNNYEAKHAVCNPDGSPRKFSSKTELYRALNEAGYTIKGDTPQPYRVAWSGKVREPERAEPIWRKRNGPQE